MHNVFLLVILYHIEQKGIFEGLFVQARIVGGANESVGRFDNNGDSQLGLLSCGAGTNNSIGHITHDHWANKTFKWTPTAGLQDSIQFVATVVRRTTTYWLNVRSVVLQHLTECPQYPATVPPLQPKPTSSALPLTAHQCAMAITLLLANFVFC